jgi:hypothetical protein
LPPATAQQQQQQQHQVLLLLLLSTKGTGCMWLCSAVGGTALQRPDCMPHERATQPLSVCWTRLDLVALFVNWIMQGFVF